MANWRNRRSWACLGLTALLIVLAVSAVLTGPINNQERLRQGNASEEERQPLVIYITPQPQKEAPEESPALPEVKLYPL